LADSANIENWHFFVALPEDGLELGVAGEVSHDVERDLNSNSAPPQLLHSLHFLAPLYNTLLIDKHPLAKAAPPVLRLILNVCHLRFKTLDAPDSAGRKRL